LSCIGYTKREKARQGELPVMAASFSLPPTH
jgi:hypothetical protein